MRRVKPELKQGEVEVDVIRLEAYRCLEASPREAIEQAERDIRQALTENGFDVSEVEVDVCRRRDNETDESGG